MVGQVSESLQYFLAMEMVSMFVKTEHVDAKLENMGFDVGLRLVERFFKLTKV